MRGSPELSPKLLGDLQGAFTDDFYDITDFLIDFLPLLNFFAEY